VGDARELGRLVRRPQHLDRRIGKREHLLQALELIHHPKARIGVPQGRQLGKRAERRVAGNERAQALENAPRHEMIEDVDDHGESLQSMVILNSRITCVHFAMSAFRNAENCSGVLPPSSMPWLRVRSLNSGRFRIRSVSALSLATTSFGVPAGATRPYQVSMSMGSPSSARVGMSG